MAFELTNKQREYLGLDPIQENWDKVHLKGDTYRPESYLYFEGNTIKRHVISTQDKYSELQYDELTNERTILLPKTSKGKDKKLTASVLEQRQPNGVYLNVDIFGNLLIGNYNTQTTFFSSRWEVASSKEQKIIPHIIDSFIEQSSETHLAEINEFKNSKRKNCKFRSGDYFSFKLNRTEFGFGRVLLDVNKVRKKGLISKEHGLSLLMGPPVLIQLFAYSSSVRKVDIAIFENLPTLPSDFMMDNLLLYGEYEIIGHKDLKEEDFEFPISFGRSLDQRRVVFLQWGLIHKELPIGKFEKYLTADNPFVAEDSYSRKVQNPFGYYSIGFRPHYDSIEVINAVENNGKFDFNKSGYFIAEFDLRNPKNLQIKREIMIAFGLNPDSSYLDNCKLTNTQKATDMLRIL